MFIENDRESLAHLAHWYQLPLVTAHCVLQIVLYNSFFYQHTAWHNVFTHNVKHNISMLIWWSTNSTIQIDDWNFIVLINSKLPSTKNILNSQLSTYSFF